MYSLKIKTTLLEHGKKEEKVKEELFILDENDNIEEQLQMLYGSWYDIIRFEIVENYNNITHVSKNYIEARARRMIRFD